MATTKKSRNTKTTNHHGTGEAALSTTVTQAIASLQAVVTSLEAHELASLTTEERTHSNGKLRDNETAAMTSVLDAIDARPGLFENLASKDHGTDDAVVETAPSRAALARRDVMKPLSDLLDVLAGRVGDDLLAQGSLAKDVTVPAYAIIQANASFDPVLRRVAAPALSFYKKVAQPKRATKIAQDVARTTKAAQKAAAKVKGSATAKS